MDLDRLFGRNGADNLTVVEGGPDGFTHMAHDRDKPVNIGNEGESIEKSGRRLVVLTVFP